LDRAKENLALIKSNGKSLIARKISDNGFLGWSILVLYVLTSVSIFSVWAVIFYHLIILALVLIIINWIGAIRQKGVINYLPRFVQYLLLEVSVFDCLCRVWFRNNSRLSLKSLVMPFVVPMTREEAYSMIENHN